MIQQKNQFKERLSIDFLHFFFLRHSESLKSKIFFSNYYYNHLKSELFWWPSTDHQLFANKKENLIFTVPFFFLLFTFFFLEQLKQRMSKQLRKQTGRKWQKKEESIEGLQEGKRICLHEVSAAKRGLFKYWESERWDKRK